MAAAQKRNERVIHTRVPAVLEKEIKRLAQSLRVPVSNVVRAILEDAVAAVDRVGAKAEGEVRGLAERLAHNRDRLRGLAFGPDSEPAGRSNGQRAMAEASASSDTAHPQGRSPLAGVIGYQPLVLAVAAACAVCGRSLARGEHAFFGVREGSGPRVLVGSECVPDTTPQDIKE